MADWKPRLAEIPGLRVQWDEPLKKHVAFRIGGPADALVSVHNSEELAAVLELAKSHGIPWMVLGSGSNILVRDRGVRGLCLKLKAELADIHVGLEAGQEFAEVQVGAGARNASLVAMVLSAGLVGIEFLGTIPGTFGGALIMNAGAHGGEIEQHVVHVDVLSEGVRVRRPHHACGFAYRSSGFAADEVLVESCLRIPRGDPSEAKAHLRHMRDRRKQTQPTTIPNAGSIFKNPPGDYAGRVIESCGLKGRMVGGAQVSELHANFIVNVDQASAQDVMALAGLVQAEVQKTYGIALEWEVKRVGEG